MNDTFKISDSYRQTLEIEAARIQDAKDKVVRDSENLVIAKFLNFYGNGVIAESTSDLNKVEGVSTTDIVFDGTVKVTANVIHGKGTKKVAVDVSVKNNTVEVAEDADLKALVDGTDVAAEEVISVAEAFPIKANLGSFKLYDDGSDYLKVFHPSLDAGKELGIIGKDEYSSLQNKESFFKEVLENVAKSSELENHYTLSFEGSFTEPTIEYHETREIVTAADLEKSEVTKTAAAEPVVEEPTTTEENLFLARQSDTLEQSVQFDVQKTQDDLNRLATRLANDVVSYLRALKYDDAKVLSVDNSDAGSFKVTASLLDSYGEKVISFSVPVRDSSYSLPKKEVVADLVSKTRDLQSIIADDIQKDTLEKLNAIDENENWEKEELKAALAPSIEKTAGGDVGGVQYIGPVDVLRVDKHSAVSSGIPEDLEVGSVIFADGFHWKLTSKDEQNLGKEANSGSIWTFSKVAPTDKQPEHELKA